MTVIITLQCIFCRLFRTRQIGRPWARLRIRRWLHGRLRRPRKRRPPTLRTARPTGTRPATASTDRKSTRGRLLPQPRGRPQVPATLWSRVAAAKKTRIIQTVQTAPRRNGRKKVGLKHLLFYAKICGKHDRHVAKCHRITDNGKCR